MNQTPVIGDRVGVNYRPAACRGSRGPAL